MSRSTTLAIAFAAMTGLAVPSTAAGQRNVTNDPFYVPPKRTAQPAPKAVESFELPTPSFAERLETCRGSAPTALATVESTPCPYLVSELRVVGIFASADGVGAFVEAKPTGQTFVVRPNDSLFDATVERIRQESGATAAAVIFSKVKRIKTGKVVREERQPVVVEVGKS